MRGAAWGSALGLALLFASESAHAGNYGYNVTYNSKIEGGGLELMSMNDITEPSLARREERFGTYLSHMVERLSMASSNQLATEFMIEWFEDLESSDRRFTGFRWETRYRLFEREVPLNPMLYAEFEDLDPATRFKMETSGWIKPPYREAEGEAPDRECILESRLVLSQDFGPVNVAFNWINETDVTSGFTAFGYAAGAMWMVGHHAGHAMEGAEGGEEHSSDHAGGVGVSLEMYWALGDTKTFGLTPARQEHYDF